MGISEEDLNLPDHYNTEDLRTIDVPGSPVSPKLAKTI